MKEIEYAAIRRRVILRWLNRIAFAINLLLFLSVALDPRYDRLPGQAATEFVWFLLVLAHGVWVSGVLGNFLRRQTEREAERLRSQGYIVNAPVAAPREKPKRAARLADDGEIEYEDEIFDPDEAQAARHRRNQD